MMDEMAKTLARRRAQAEKKPDVSTEKNLCCFFFCFSSVFNQLKKTFRHILRRRIQIMINLVHGKNPIHYHIN